MKSHLKEKSIKPFKMNGREYNESQGNAIKNVLSNLEGLHIIHGPQELERRLHC